MPSMSHGEFVARIDEERKKGNVVFMDFEGGMVSVPLGEMISQPAVGILYDLNRSPEVVATFFEKDETYGAKWVNDYAVGDVIVALKDEIERLRKALVRISVASGEATTIEGLVMKMRNTATSALFQPDKEKP